MLGKSKATMQLIYSTTTLFQAGGTVNNLFLIGNNGNLTRGCHGRMDDLFFSDQTDGATIQKVLNGVDIEGPPKDAPGAAKGIYGKMVGSKIAGNKMYGG